jgi:hypothetical protein
MNTLKRNQKNNIAPKLSTTSIDCRLKEEYKDKCTGNRSSIIAVTSPKSKEIKGYVTECGGDTKCEACTLFWGSFGFGNYKWVGPHDATCARFVRH